MSSLSEEMYEFFTEDEIWFDESDKVANELLQEKQEKMQIEDKELIDWIEWDLWININNAPIKLKELHEELPKNNWRRKTAILIDWTNFLFRYYYWIWPMYDSQLFWAENINWIYWMLNKILWHIKNRVDYLYVCWEGWKLTRKQIFSEYKTNRDDVPKNIRFQCDVLHNILKKLHIPSVFYSWYEADDTIATLARKIDERENWNVNIYIHSTDKDFNQLLKHNIYLFKPNKKSVYSVEDFQQEFWFDIKYFIDYLSLIWDTSDNIPWLKWIWKVWAKKIIQEYWTIENLYKNAKDAIQKKLIWKKSVQEFITKECAQKLMLNKKLIEFLEVPNVEIFELHQLWWTYSNYKKIIVDELNFWNFALTIEDIFHY